MVLALFCTVVVTSSFTCVCLLYDGGPTVGKSFQLLRLIDVSFIAHSHLARLPQGLAAYGI